MLFVIGPIVKHAITKKYLGAPMQKQFLSNKIFSSTYFFKVSETQPINKSHWNFEKS